MTFLVIEIHDSRQLGKARIELGNRVSPIGNIAFVAVVAQLGHDDGFAEPDYQIVARLQYFTKGTVTAEFTFVVFENRTPKVLSRRHMHRPGSSQ